MIDVSRHKNRDNVGFGKEKAQKDARNYELLSDGEVQKEPLWWERLYI